MRNVWYPLKKEYPKLGLKIWIERERIWFSGNKTPGKLVGKDSICHFGVYDIASQSYPAIDVGGIFYIGGREDNNVFEESTDYFNKETYPFTKFIKQMNKTFGIQQLNKQIHIL